MWLKVEFIERECKIRHNHYLWWQKSDVMIVAPFIPECKLLEPRFIAIPGDNPFDVCQFSGYFVHP
jgi:hypothetical protein